MFLKIDNENNILEVTNQYSDDCIEFNGAIDINKLLFAKLIDGKIIYDENSYNDMNNNRNKYILFSKEIYEIENWFIEYDKICNEHLRCQRLGIECHHNIIEWDNMAVEKAKKLNELRKKI